MTVASSIRNKLKAGSGEQVQVRTATSAKKQQESSDDEEIGSNCCGLPLSRKKPPPESPMASAEHSASSYDQYVADRQKLLDDERKLAWDEPARRSASPEEVTANKILLKIRENDRVDPELYGNLPGEAIPDPETRDMGGKFLVNKERIDRSKVFKIAQAMPKGTHLHLHLNAELPPEILFPRARDLKTMFVRTTQPLVRVVDFRRAEVVLEVQPEDTPSADIFSESYDHGLAAKPKFSGAWMRWSDFRAQFARAVAKAEALAESEDVDKTRSMAEKRVHFEYPPQADLDDAERWAREKMIITHHDAYGEGQTTNGVWACFNIGTRAFKGLVGYESAYRAYIGMIIDSMIRDKVMYAELRPMFWTPISHIMSDDGKTKLDRDYQMRIIKDELEKKKGEFPLGLKVIYCVPRVTPREKGQGPVNGMKEELQACLDMRLNPEFGHLICGFDIVGAEDRPNPIGLYADLLVEFTNNCRKAGVNIPFMFHAGESLIDTGGTFDPKKSNLYDAGLLNTARIGHGYSLLKHPVLLEKYKEKNICLELCPISNELLGLCTNARQHTFSELLAAGLQCTLNADNPALFRGPNRDSKSLSYEFYQVLVGDPRMNLHGWKQLALWSIKHARFTEEERALATDTFEKDWKTFCQWVVKTYGRAAMEIQGQGSVSLPDMGLEDLTTEELA